MSLGTQPYKGARDFYPEDKRLQKYLFGVMRSVAERFGYEEYDAPIIEPTDLFLAKGNDEIIKEQTYTFTDRGNRSVTLRTEMTPSVTRMVAAKRQELAYPLRLYSIPNLWRYERTQRGRLREFWQLNVDLFGIDNLMAELEMIQLADSLLRAYGATRDMYTIKLSSRKLTDYILSDYLKLDADKSKALMHLIDRKDKMEAANFMAAVNGIMGSAERLVDILAVAKLEDLPETLKSHQSVKELQELLELLDKTGITNVVFDPALIRGFDYYSDIVFEVFDNDPNNNRSMLGGGRYDSLVAQFDVESLPTIGFGLGDVTLQNFLETNKLLPVTKPETELYVVLIGEVQKAAQKVVSDLREMGLNVAVDYSGRKPDKQLKAAAKKGVPYALFIGEKELADEQYMLKDLLTGKEQAYSPQRVVSAVKDFRNS